MTSPTSETEPGRTPEIQQMQRTAGIISAWLKFLGIIHVFGGALIALTIVGVLVAWLPIWLGVVLFQAGNHASRAHHLNDLQALAQMLDKLKLYFIISAASLVVGLAFTLTGLTFGGMFIEAVLNNLPTLLQSF